MTQTDQLTRREWEVVELLLKDKSNKLIASSLCISTRTVELILFLGDSTGGFVIEKLGDSTVVDDREITAENRDKPYAQMG